MRTLLAIVGLLSWGVVAMAESPVPVGQSSYFMRITTRHVLAVPFVRHHDYEFFERTPNGDVIRSEASFGMDMKHFDIRHPVASLFRPVPGRMGTVAESDANALKKLTISRVHERQITAGAYYSEQEHLAQINSGMVKYQAIPGVVRNGIDNCITSGIPPIVNPMRAGIGPFAAPRIFRAMDRQGLIIK